MAEPDVDLITRTAGETLSVRRAFGEAYAHEDTLVIPVAKVVGGTGSGFGGGQLGGSQESASGTGEGSGGGGGFGAGVRPLGVYVVRGDAVTWRPAIDAHRLGTQAAAVGIALALVWAVRRRRRG